MPLSHSGVGMTELLGDHRHRYGPHGEDRCVGMPEYVEPNCGGNANPRTEFTHGTQLLGTLPAATLSRWKITSLGDRPELAR